VIRVHTLGGLSVRGDDGNSLSGAVSQPRRIAILALLARAGERGMSRERILALLWPDADDERGPRALTQALYALRKDLGAEEAIVGAKELRFDPALVNSDVAEFTSAVARGDDLRAVALYQGPFLDGFHLPAADAFARWVDQERATLAQEQVRTLESLARNAFARGNAAESVTWWRKLAGLEPLNARVTVGLMEALAASGDRAGALKHVHVYQLLVQQELDLPPDKEVLALADRLRRQDGYDRSDTVGPIVLAAGVTAEPAAPESSAGDKTPATDPGPLSPLASSPQQTFSRGILAAALIVGIGALAVVVAARARAPGATKHTASGDSTAPVVAVGRIAAFGLDSTSASLAAPLADLLTTSLARVRSIRVVSHGRMLELMRVAGTPNDTSAGRFVNAARQAGATEVIDGTLYTRPGGRLRLDLHRVDLSTGAIGDVHTIEGSDLFALVDSGTARIVAALGTDAPLGAIADVTTRSVAAYRMYEQGIHAYYRGDYREALGFFDGALAEDSLFALAAYYAAMSDPVPESNFRRMERAKRLASRATDRERLIILAGWARGVSSPAMRAFAETLATRYPSEIQGHLSSGIARVYDGEFLAALEPLERVIVMDSAGLRGAGSACGACDAFRWRVSAYILADSLSAAEREARRWLRLQPRSAPAANALVEVLDDAGRAAEADSTFRATAPSGLSHDEAINYEIGHLLRIGDYATADRLLAAKTREPGARQQLDAYWTLAFSLREQGRLTAALDAARRVRPLQAKLAKRTAGTPSASALEAQVQFESQHPALAAAIFDSLSREHDPEDAPSQRARRAAWTLTLAAGARVASGDTATLARLADSVRTLGAESGYGRDHRLYHHVLGLLLAARGDDAGAIREFRAAIYSLTSGFTRTNYELARIYLRTRRPRDAIAVLQPALRAPLESSNLYLARPDAHELLAQAWDAAGNRDSAAVHYAWVAKAWTAADPSFASRLQTARIKSSIKS
jgi:DNA-binding SARP family transcriptional activator/TolB-like protein